MVKAGLIRWWELAACRGMDTNLFFPTDGDYSALRPVCEGCDVRRQCLADAMAQDLDMYGFWGGLTPKERDRLRRGAERYGNRLSLDWNS